MRRFILNSILVVFLLISGGFASAQQLMPQAVPSGAIGAQPRILKTTQPTPLPKAQLRLTPEEEEKLKKLSPEQQKAIQAELVKTGGVLTPEALDALKNTPEFKGLTTEEIVKGKEALERKEDIKKKEDEKKKAGEKKPLEEVVPKQIEVVAEEDKTLFERFRAIGGYQDISTLLKPFGYEFFREAAVRVVTDRKDIPVPGNYVVGPGDEVKILLWGRVNAQHNLTVDRNGNITIPQIGPTQVAGMTFEDMSKHLIKQSEQIVGGNIDITMGSLKSIPIFVLGDVRRPGAYTIGSFATMTDALLMAGGPTGIGSMRNVQLKRKGKVVKTFDLYDLFLKGDKSNDKMLEAGDVVFVPVAGSLVGIAGNVKRPAIYEIKDKHNLQTLFDLAGGIIPTAYTQQIQVERIIKNEKQVIVDIDDKHLLKAKDFLLQDADLVKVFNIVEKDENVVFVNGHVKRPGKYEYKTGMRISDIIKDSTDLLPETYYEYALIKRLVPPDIKPELIPFNLGKSIFDKDQVSNIELRPRDNIYVFSKWFFKEKPFVTVQGAVREGGRFELIDNFRVKDAILLAGGLSKEAYIKKAEIIRLNDKREYESIYFDVEKAMAGDASNNVLLRDEDKIVVHLITGYTYRQTVTVDGAVPKPGDYPYVENMTVKDLIFAGGNLTESAYLEEADISYQVVESGKSARIEHRKINLKKALEGDSEHNLALQPYSRLFVKQIPKWREMQFVTIAGEVKFPGKYMIQKGERLSSLIERAGDYTDRAYLRGASFTRIRVKAMQERNLEDVSVRLERELLAAGAEKVSAATSKEEIEAKKAEYEQKKQFIDTLKKLKPIGRFTIRLAHLRLLKGSEYDVELEEGDNLYIPTANNVVSVAGSTMFQGSFMYSEDRSYKDYIQMSGGYTSNADVDNVFILKADGTAVKPKSSIFWNSNRSRWELAALGETAREVEPGDTIVVPDKVERVAWLRDIKDITQILANVALTAGVFKALY